MFWQSVPFSKSAQPTQVASAPQPSKYVYIPPGNQARAASSSFGSAVLSDDQEQQGDDVWKDEGDGDSGVEDETGTESVQCETKGDSLTVTASSKRPALKSVRYVAKHRDVAMVRLGSKVTKQIKAVGEPGTAGRMKGQKLVKTSIWDRLGSKVGESKVSRESVIMYKY